MEQVAEFTESLREFHSTNLREIDAKLSLVVIETANIILCLKRGTKIHICELTHIEQVSPAFQTY